jgi:putative PIN family toxin of toxin-antitoxin system
MAPASKPRVFLDANIIFSGLYSPRGAPGVILEHYVNSRITAVISQQVLEEVIRTIRKKNPAALSLLKTLLTNVPPEIVADPPVEALKQWTPMLDIGDAAVLAAAVLSEPDYFITGDNDFLRNRVLIKKAGLRILTPAELLKQLADGV